MNRPTPPTMPMHPSQSPAAFAPTMHGAGWQAPPPPIPWNAPIARPLGEPSKDDAMIAAAAHGLSFVEGGLVGPFVVYMVRKDESAFVAFHALQSLYFGILFLAVSLLTCGVGALFLIWPYLWFEGVATLKAFDGEWYQLPIVGARAYAKHPRPTA